MLLTQRLDVTIRGGNYKHYLDRGYDIPMHECRNKKRAISGSVINIDVNDLPKGSDVKVLYKCDNCGEIYSIDYYTYNKKREKSGKDFCKKCVGASLKLSLLNKYGEDGKIKMPNYVLEKRKQTNKKKFGCEYPSQSLECKKKATKTHLEKYGHEHHTQRPEEKQRRRELLLERGSYSISSQQHYIHNLYGGELNYLIDQFYVDIYDKENNICIEYDGGGHNLQVETGNLTQKEFEQRELIREKIIRQNGSRLIRIISPTDKLPSDEILLQMLHESLEYFNATNHTWRKYYVELGIMKDAEHKDGAKYDYGTLWNAKVLANQNKSA